MSCKTYIGIPHRNSISGQSLVSVSDDRKSEPLPLRLDLFNHSPTGFSWGYGGSGPAQLALALLADALGDDGLAVRLHQAFNSGSWLVEGERWWITADQIAAVVKVIKEETAKRTELPGSTTAAVSTGEADAA